MIPSPHSRKLHAVWLGTRPYQATFQLQRELHEHTKGANDDLVLLLEHEACITLGRGAHAEHLLASPETLSTRGVNVQHSDRGGDITLHAPGQLVAYPIVNLSQGERDVRRYVNSLTQVMADLVRPWGINAGTIDKMVGLWTDTAQPGQWSGVQTAHSPAKLGAIGVRISRWVTMHGFALNFSTDLSLFGLIVPCGIKQYPVTSVASLVGDCPKVHELTSRAHAALCQHLGRRPGESCAHDGPLTAEAILSAITR